MGEEGGTFFFDVLSLTGFRSFGDGFAEQRHELAIAGAHVSVFRWEVALDL